MVNTPFDEEGFRQAMQERLCDVARMPDLSEAFAKALVESLAGSYPSLKLGNQANRRTVAAYFTSPGVIDIAGLLIAVERACQAQTPLSADSDEWATELAIYAAMRSLDHTQWSHLAQAAAGGATPGSAAMPVPTVPPFLAAIAWCAYNGVLLARHLEAGAYRGGGLDMTENMMRKLYDALVPDRLTVRPYPDLHLTDPQKTDLKLYFENDRHNDRRRRTVVSVAVEGEYSEVYEQAEVLAKIIDHPVLVPEQHTNGEAIKPQARVTSGTLAARLQRLFAQLPSYMAKAQAANHPTPPLPQAAARQPKPPGPPTPAPSAFAAPVQTAQAMHLATFNYDLFISHASEDKTPFVNQLVATLQAAGMRVWYDQEQLFPGDSLVKSINKGLAQSRFAVLVLSPRYFAKNWAQAEGRAVSSMQFSDARTRLIPIYFEIGPEAVRSEWPLLADILGIDAAKHSVLTIASKIEAVLTRPPQD